MSARSTILDDTAPGIRAITPRRLRSIIGGAAGNLLEWYDFLIYTIFSIYFAKAFFPDADQTVQLLNTAAIAAVGYIARPVGSWLMGVYADRRGRRAALALSVTLMCLGSFGIAITPGYAAIGVMAPILLIVARLLQGLSMGGEYSASATYLSEMAPPKRRGFYVGFLQVTVVSGQLLALAIMLVLQHSVLTTQQFESWGWRIPFVIGGVMAIFALYLRRGIDETGAFIAHQHNQPRASLVAALLIYWRQVLLAVGISIGGTVSFYTYTVYMQKFIVNTAGFSKDQATLITSAALLLYLPLQPLFGLLSDRIGRRPVLLIFAISATVLTVPLLEAMSHAHSLVTVFLLNFAGLVTLSGFTSIHMLVKSELFPAEIRVLGVGLPYAIATSVLGGTTEFVALRLKAAGHEPYFYWYVSGCAAISLVVYLFMPETSNHSQIDEDLLTRNQAQSAS